MLDLKPVVVICVGALLWASPLQAQAAPLQPEPAKPDQWEFGTAEESVRRHELIEGRVKAEFTAWRYPGALVGETRLEGAVCSLTAMLRDDPAKVWAFYVNQIPTEDNIPLIKLPAAKKDSDILSWKKPDGTLYTHSSPTLGIAYSIILPPPPRDQGTIIYQKGEETVYLEVRARSPEVAARTGIQTDISLIKLRPLNSPQNQALKPIFVQGSVLTVIKPW